MGKWKLVIALILTFCSAHLLFAQVSNYTFFSFHPTFGNTPLHPGDSFYSTGNTDSIQIETLKFYISGIQLLDNNEVVWKEENSFHLLDASQVQSLTIALNMASPPHFNRVKFNIGIDSVTNVSGALGGDLDPTRGMYWAWQSGYINIKLEGKCKLCETRNNEFEFHLGGYLNPDYCLKTITLNVSGSERSDIAVDLEQFINDIKLSKQNQVMSPAADAVLLAEKFSKIFNVQP